MQKKKFSWKAMTVLLLFVALAVAVVLPHYLWTIERAKAGAAEAALINVAVAENLYYIHHKNYTNDWQQLQRYIPENVEIQGKFAPAPEPGEERFFAFSQEGLENGRDGFSFGIELNEDSSAGKVYAVRSSGLFAYTLGEAFPKPVFSCEADGTAAKWFCNKFDAYIAPFLMRKTNQSATQAENAAETKEL